MLALALILTLEVSPTAAASAKACRVTNTDSGRTYTRLQQAVDAAKPGVRLVVTGMCHGGTFIDKDIAIAGVATRETGKPVLDGDERERVLVVKPGVRVSIRDLTIRDGRARKVNFGAGISNHGHLTLRDVVVRDNRTTTGDGGTDFGGGIFNAGFLRLHGSTRVAHNVSSSGGGVYNTATGTMLMRDSSRIERNLQHRGLSGGWGYGVLNIGTLTLRGSSSIDKNRGGGVWNNGYGVINYGTLNLEGSSRVQGNSGGVRNIGGSVTMTGSSTIRDNHLECPPTGSGCIVWGLNPPHPAGLDSRGGTLIGVNCAPHTYANVYGNTPDDCYIEP
jgi:hypothetical protein